MKKLFIGRGRSLTDQRLFHKVSLIAVLAWVGLGADGLSSSCYGPEETFKALGAHTALAPFIALVRAGSAALPFIQDLPQQSPDPKIQAAARQFLAMSQPPPQK